MNLENKVYKLTVKQDRIDFIQDKQGLTGKVMVYGNSKLPKTTLVFNHTTATDCPSKEFCKHRDVCYALKCERLYTKYLARNKRNFEWFKNASLSEIKDIFDLYIREAPKNNPIKTVRLNEAGDFYNQEAVEKFNHIATYLKRNCRWPTCY